MTTPDDINRINKDLEETLNQVAQAKQTEEKTVKVARLIVLLIKIEQELNTINQTLHKLLGHAIKNKNIMLTAQIEEKLQTVERLSEKIRKARLNLNYYFI